MPLTKEQFQKARDAGYTVEQIAGFEQKRNGEQQTVQTAEQPIEQQEGFAKNAPQSRFQLKSETPYNSYGYNDAALDTLKTLVNSVADLGKSVSQPILNPVQTVKDLSTAITHPIETAQGIGKYISDRYGTMEKLAETVSKDPFGFSADVVTAVTVAKGISKTGGLVKNEKLAGNVVNSLIKPTHKQYMFGSNPGRGIAKEGLVANSLEGLSLKVEERLTKIDDAIKTIRNTPENISKTIDLSIIKKPLIDSIKELKKAPKTHSAEISNIENALSDIGKLTEQIGSRNITNIAISDAYNIKGVISKMQKWSHESQAGSNLNAALKKVYHIVDDKIDMAIPEVKQLNSRMADLISAKQAIYNRIEKLRNTETMPTLMRVIDLPFAAAKTTRAKTVLGKLLAKQYSLPKK